MRRLKPITDVMSVDDIIDALRDAYINDRFIDAFTIECELITCGRVDIAKQARIEAKRVKSNIPLEWED